MVVAEGSGKRKRTLSAADMEQVCSCVNLSAFCKSRWQLLLFRGQAANLEEFLFGAGSAAVEGFGKEQQDTIAAGGLEVRAFATFATVRS